VHSNRESALPVYEVECKEEKKSFITILGKKMGNPAAKLENNP
jgi:hypothetical protein